MALYQVANLEVDVPGITDVSENDVGPEPEAEATPKSPAGEKKKPDRVVFSE